MQITHNQADDRADHALYQTFDHDHLRNLAAGRTNRAQHGDVVTALNDHRAEGVEDQECAQEQRQHTQQIEDGKADLHRRKALVESFCAFSLKPSPSAF